MNKVDELAKIIETGLAEGGALYDVDFEALKNARKALAELVSLAQPEAARMKCFNCGLEYQPPPQRSED